MKEGFTTKHCMVMSWIPPQAGFELGLYDPKSGVLTTRPYEKVLPVPPFGWETSDLELLCCGTWKVATVFYPK